MPAEPPNRRPLAPNRWPLARLSLGYLILYLSLLGPSLLFAPSRALRTLGASGSYDDLFPRIAGMFLVGLAMITCAVVYWRFHTLYPGIVAVRSFFCVCFYVFYRTSGDPVCLVFLAIVAVGVVLTSFCLLVDWRRERSAGAGLEI